MLADLILKTLYFSVSPPTKVTNKERRVLECVLSLDRTHLLKEVFIWFILITDMIVFTFS